MEHLIINLSLYELQEQCADIQAIDFFLARELTESLLSLPANKDKEADLLFYSVMAVSEALREGHSCLKLSEYAGQLHWQNTEEEKPGFRFPDLNQWHDYLFALALSPAQNSPLVYEYQRLYLRRYRQFEYELAVKISGFLNNTPALDMPKAKNILGRLFPEQNNMEPDWQKIAVANSLCHSLSIIAGGPGTGKTFTVTRLLAALQLLTLKPLNIAMVAPTGKAAQRLNESIANAKHYLLDKQLVSEEVLKTIPETASTIHRLLGFRYGSHNFHYNEERLLPYEVLLVDEISMIDLPLMTRLFRAIDSHCRVILLGDADQLPSVAAGSILSDLAPEKLSLFSARNTDTIKTLTGYDLAPFAKRVEERHYDHLTVLQKSHRFDGSGEIGQLAQAVIEGHVDSSWRLLQQGQTQIAWSSSQAFSNWLETLVEQFYRPLYENQSSLSVAQAFECLNRFRFLCAIRQGDQSVRQINDRVEQYLQSRGWIQRQSEYYPGRPILVTENHYTANLYNGDIGLLWTNPEGRLQAVFPDPSEVDNQGFRWLSLGRLPAIETVYAMTIHKTQGSEFEHVALVLPSDDSPVLSRELLYTGITRAKEQLSVFCSEPVWQQTVKRKVQRFSGLSKRVFG